MFGTMQDVTDFGRVALDFLNGNMWLWAALSAIFCIDILYLLLHTAKNTRKKGWDGAWFMLLCAAVLVWFSFNLVHYLLLALGHAPQDYWVWAAAGLRYIGYVFVPLLLFLHVWRQVSYRQLPWYLPLAGSIIPFAMTGWVIWQVVAARTNAAITGAPLGFGLWEILFYLYYAMLEVGCLLQLLSVFFQMPEHMRKSARYMLAGVLLYALCSGVQFMLRPYLVYDLIVPAAIFLLHTLHSAFGQVSSANVIATSRELVMQNLSTVVLVANTKGYVVDWSTKGHGPLMYLPQPRYLEGMSHYRKRLLEECGGRVSRHDEGIITFSTPGGEVHFLMASRKLMSKKRALGYLVEISDITRVYSVFRTLEETATVDQLTGLHNRNAYLGWVHTLVTAENMPLLVLVGDVNNLKPVNDVYGHLEGDRLLQEVAAIMRGNVPEGSFAARIGGDEFVVLAPHQTEAVAEAFIDKCREDCEKLPYRGKYPTGVSWGYAVMQSAAEDYNQAFSRADEMMYAYKKKRARFRSSGFVPEKGNGEPEAGAPPPQDATDEHNEG